jgi:hypothetical protein
MMYRPQMPDVARADFEQRAHRRSSLRRLLFDTLGAVALGVLLSLQWWPR